MMEKLSVPLVCVVSVLSLCGVVSAATLGPLNLLVESTGDAWIVNPSTDAVDFEGYQISSVGENLEPSGWFSLTDRGEPDWEVLSSSEDLLAEAVGVTSSEFYTLDGGESRSLGAPVSAETPLDDLSFTYTALGGESFQGEVIPEPTTLALLSLAALAVVRRRRGV
ncbi:MAG: PEP-CTERM sorting domain-containing protein [Phycisphaerae bacterium]